MPVDQQSPIGRPSLDSTFSLTAGVKLEPFADGSAVLYATDQRKSLSLNHTAALLCSYADGVHTLSTVLRATQQLFPDGTVEEGPVVECLMALAEEGFLEWE